MRTLRILKKQHGVSLVEVLAVIIILSVVGVLLFSIISSGQKQYSNQSTKNQELKDISYALKVITKEIRQNPGTIEVDSDINQLEIKGVKYKRSGTNLMRGTVTFVSNIDDFIVNKTSDTVKIKLKSSTGQEVSTQITERR